MDFYVVLGIERKASRADVEKAYTRLARRYHPDINPGDSEAAAFFQRVSEAYETLSDPSRRKAYDADGAPQASSPRASVEFRGFDFSTPTSGASATFSELFSDVLTRPADDEVDTHKGSDLFGEIALGFDEALKGTERQLTVTRLDTCAVCAGSGLRRSTETRCTHCHGRGATQWRRGHMVFARTCDRCGGSGRQRLRPCVACRAEGTATVTEEITIQVPAGVADGARMRVGGKGNAGRRGAGPGDLYITALVAPHRLFGRQGDDVTVQVPIEVHEAALGATITIPTPDGKTRLDIPAGTESGREFRLGGLGAPSPRSGSRGDLVVEVRIVVPLVDDERSKALLREFGRLRRANVRDDLFTE